jgi:hypothetical protein
MLICSQKQKCMNHIRIMIDGEVTQQCIFTQNKSILYYIKMNTMFNQWRANEEKQHDENKLISLA